MSQSIAFIDNRVTDYQTLIAGLPGDIEVILIDGGNGLQQMADTLAGRSGIDAIHIFSHGRTGAVQLGGSTLSNDNLDIYASQLIGIGQSLTKDGDVLLYGCNVGGGEAGRNFVESIARIVQADVAASVDLTGDTALGGNWLLERRVGTIESNTLLIGNWSQALAFAAGNDAGSANEAGGALNGTAGSNATGNVLSNDVNASGNNSGLNVTAIRTGNTEGAGTAGSVGSSLGGAYGAITLNGNGTFVYVINDSNATVQGISVGQTLTEYFNYTMSDGAISDAAVLTITINGANDSPTLDASKTPALADSLEDKAPTNGSTVGSTLVSALVDAGGALSNFTDPDSGTTAGIAISGFAAGGNLWYSTNSGTTWTQATGLSATNTLKLKPDASTRVYFESTTADFMGTVSAAITFHAWDGGGGTNGSIGGNTYTPISLSEVGSLSALSNNRGLAVSGSYAYLADQAGGIRVVDTTTPGSPSLTASVFPSAGSASDIAVSGGYAYVTLWTTGLAIFNLSNPAAPTQSGIIGTVGAADSVAISGSYAYVADYSPAGGAGNLRVVNVSNPASPSLTATLSLGGSPSDITVVGTTAYVAGGSGFGLKIIDISNPASPSVLGTYAGTGNGVSVVNGYAYLVNSSGLTVIDVSNPASPTSKGTVSTGSGVNYNVVVDGDYAYVAANAVGIKLVNISNPTAPVVVGTLDTPGTAWDVALATGYVFASDGSSMRVLSRSGTAVSSVSSTSDTANVTISGTADTPSITNATTSEDVQSASGLVISRNAADSTEVTHFKIAGITGGTLYKNNGTTQITDGTFITFAEGNAGLKFTPTANSNSNGNFTAQASTSDAAGGLGGSTATATITVNPVGDTPGVTNATTNEDTQSSSGLVISRNAADSTEVTHFKISTISGGTLYKNDGTTAISNGDYITFAEGNAGLKFTPTANSTTSGTVNIQSSRDGATAEGTAATATVSITPIADTPSVTNANTTSATQTSSGLVLSRNAVDGAEVTYFKITGITNGNLFKSDGTTQITDDTFITFAEGNAGLKFTPTGGGNGSFTAQASTSNANGGLGGSTVNATISLGAAVASPTVNEDTDTGAIAISLGGSETHYKITSISGGTLYSDAAFTQQIMAGSFIAQGGGGGNATTTNVYFRPTANNNSTTGGNGSFIVQASTSNADSGLTGSQLTSTVTLTPVADTPSVTDVTVPAGTQSTTGLVLSRNVGDGPETTHFKIAGITNGTLYQSDGTTQINDDDFITFAQGNAGLKFTPSGTADGSFTAQASIGSANGGLGGSTVAATATVTVPQITSATYNALTGVLVVMGSNFLALSGAANDIVANKFTLTGQASGTYTLTDTANVEIASATNFTLTLSATDKAAVNALINKTGAASNDNTTYNLAAAEDWAAGAAATVVVADLAGNGITATVNQAPVITSNGAGATAAINVAENGTAVTTVVATDADAGQIVTYSLAGGADQARFNINASTGALAFVTAPNFEAPTDADNNNSYLVQVTASDGNGGTAAQAITVTVTDVDETPPADPTPTPTPTPNPPVVNDGDNIPAAVENQTPSLPNAGGTTVAGDGNGDGVSDSTQSNVTSTSFLKTGQVTTDTTAPATFVSLVADSKDGAIDTTDTTNAVLTNIVQKDAPANLPAGITMPLGLISFTATVGTSSTGTGSAPGVGITETFSLFVDASLGVNGYWKQDKEGTWVNLASDVNGGKLVTVGDKVRLDFQIQDGGVFDADGKIDGIITDPGAAAFMPQSLLSHIPELPQDSFWF